MRRERAVSAGGPQTVSKPVGSRLRRVVVRRQQRPAWRRKALKAKATASVRRVAAVAREFTSDAHRSKIRLLVRLVSVFQREETNATTAVRVLVLDANVMPLGLALHAVRDHRSESTLGSCPDGRCKFVMCNLSNGSNQR